MKDTLEFFSIIIPLYNKEISIKRAISSVLNQTYPHFELIIVDDGFTDRSVVEASKFIDPRIRIIRQENKGASAARNRGVSEANHEWIAFLDADDEWFPEFLSLIINLHFSFPDCGLLGSAFVPSTDKGLDVSYLRKSLYPYGWKGILGNYYKDLFHSPFYTSTVVLRKDLFLKAGEFPLTLRKGEDTYLWINILSINEFRIY